MAFKFELVSRDGDNLGSIETSGLNPQPGDELLANGNLPYRIESMLPLERIAEFVDRPVNGVLKVEPLQTYTSRANLELRPGLDRRRRTRDFR